MPRILFLFILTLCGSTYAQDDSFVFRNEVRPSFDQVMSVAQLKEKRQQEDLVILDVRLQEDFDKDPAVIPGAVYVNPENLPQWVSTLSAEAEVVVYCVAGKWVSQKVAFLLDQQGVNVSSLAGGFEAWKQED
ncbi:MAG: hypothetical protein DHS20C12_15730 [Pseudohongiella sp.]|nr:MAG: hypothetical protein DHS20C12_15730 [Pseudohongiella sp.]